MFGDPIKVCSQGHRIQDGDLCYSDVDAGDQASAECAVCGSTSIEEWDATRSTECLGSWVDVIRAAGTPKVKGIDLGRLIEEIHAIRHVIEQDGGLL